MKTISEKVIESLEKEGFKPAVVATIPMEEFLNSHHHKDVVEFIRKKQEHEKWCREYPSKIEYRSGHQLLCSYSLN